MPRSALYRIRYGFGRPVTRGVVLTRPLDGNLSLSKKLIRGVTERKRERKKGRKARQWRVSRVHPKPPPPKVDAAQLALGRDVVDDELLTYNSVVQPQ